MMRLGQIAAADAVAEMRARYRARRRLLDFCRYCWPYGGTDPFMVGDHTLGVCSWFDSAIARYKRGLSSYGIIRVPVRHGKALEVSTPIATPAGFVPISQLRAGDNVFDERGFPVKVVAKSDVFCNRDVYEVVTSDGYSIVADGQHEWPVILDNRIGAKPKTTEYLYRRQWRGTVQRPLISKHGALVLSKRTLPIVPYVLGLWLGDGRSTDSGICIGPQDSEWLCAEIEREGFRVRKWSSKYAYNIMGLHLALRANGLLGRKHIPSDYLWSDTEDRLALLQGLMDTDGYASPDGQCEFCSTNKPLADGVRHLVVSLGYKASLVLGRACVNGKDCGLKYRVMFYMPGCFRLPRKLARCRSSASGLRCPNRAFSLFYRGKADTVCIQVSGPSSQYLCGRGLVATHNSQIASRMLPAFALGHLWHADPDIMLVGADNDLAVGFSRDAQAIVQAPEYSRLFPGVTLHPKYTSASEWGCAHRHRRVRAFGFDSIAVGRGATLLLPDDWCGSREDAENPQTRDKRWTQFTNDLLTRLAPVHIVCLVGTPWHVDGLQERILKRMREDPRFPRFDLVSFPARRQQADGTWAYLFEARMGRAWYELQYATKTAYEIAGLLDVDPKPAAGNLATRGMFKRITMADAPQCRRRVRYWDTAATATRRSDWTCGALVGLHDLGDCILDIHAARVRALDVGELIAAVARADGYGVEQWIECEKGSMGLIGPAELARPLVAQGYDVRMAYRPKGSKLATWLPTLGRAWQGRVDIVDRPNVETFLAHIDAAPDPEYDDDLDAVCGASGALHGERESEAVVGGEIARGW